MMKRYYDSPYIREFTARVEECSQGKKGWEVVLDETAFYPEGGGQPADTGMLGDAKVTDVHEKDGRIIHFTDGPLPEGETVTGVIDWDRRFGHMQGHSGEHLVSGLIHRHFGYDNVGFHMGTDEITIDFNGLLTWEDLKDIEEEANGIIYENREILAEFPSGEELKKLDYRSKKELSGQIRIVTIPGGDICACCGTHVKYTGEIGIVKFTSMMHYKGGVRITLRCGKKALEDYERKREEIQKVSVLLSAKPEQIGAAVEKMKEDLVQAQVRSGELCRQLVELKVSAMQETDGAVFFVEPDFEAVPLRQMVNRMLEEKKGTTVLGLSGRNDGYFYVLGSRTDDMRICSKELNGLLNGRGGGSAQMAQGTFFTQEKVLRAVLKEKGFSSPET